MPISFEITGDNADQLIAEARTVFGPLFSAVGFGTPLPPMQEQPKRDEPAPQPSKPEVIPPEPKKTTRGKKDKDPETIEGTVEQPKAEIPDIETLRAKLKTLGDTNYDAVFPLLEKYGAKSASTVPEDKRADVIADITKLLEEARP